MASQSKPEVEMDEDEAAALYDLLDGGSSRSTKAGKASAMKHFNAYLQSRRLGSAATLSREQWCDADLYQMFATYLAENAKKSNGDLIMSGTATQYLSAVKEFAMTQTKGDPFWALSQILY